MQRNNDQIIQISSEMAEANRKFLMALIEAGAPADLLQPLLHTIDVSDSVPERLANRSEPCGIYSIEHDQLIMRAAAESVHELLKPQLQELLGLIERFKD